MTPLYNGGVGWASTIEGVMRKYRMVISCKMMVGVSVEAENEEKVREWFDKNPSELYSLIESPKQDASDLKLENVVEFGWAKPEFTIE